MSSQQSLSPKEIVDTTITQLKEEGVYAGFGVGKKIPNFQVQDTDGKKVKAYDLLEDHEFLVINFFRGDWCGYCKKEMVALQDNYDRIKQHNAEVLSIAPQNIETLARMKEERNLEFPVAADPNLEVANLFNLVWQLPDSIKEVYLEEYDLNIEELNANNSWELPVPATYIVNGNGDVVSKFEDLNYRKRMDVENIISILQQQSVED